MLVPCMVYCLFVQNGSGVYSRRTAVLCCQERYTQPTLLLQDVRVVLVAPKHAANIGAAARVAANFEVGKRSKRLPFALSRV